MPTARSHHHMTAEERRREIAGILAAGVLHPMRQPRRSVAPDSTNSSDARDSRAELGANSPLSVAQPPAARGSVRWRPRVSESHERSHTCTATSRKKPTPRST